MLTPLKKRWSTYPVLTEDANGELGDYLPEFRQILFNRGIVSREAAGDFLYAATTAIDPFRLAGMHEAIERLLRAIEKKEEIVVYGDYDVDGVTATAMLVQVLRAMGGIVDHYIPDRFEEGYGLNRDALSKLKQNGCHLVVTVDCGIRSLEEARHAAGLGLDLIISDHHQPKVELPEAIAVVCPRREDDSYPEKNLAGVGVAYKIVQALLEKSPVDGKKAEDWLDLVALGTVADMVPLVGENRSLVRAGLNRIRTKPRQGVFSLAQVARLDYRRIKATEIGFQLGPRLNAAGRLETAEDAYKILMSTSENEAGLLAQKLDDQNQERQKQTKDMQAQVENSIQATETPEVLFAFDAGFNSGVVGLVAARLTETYHRPSIVGRMDEDTTRASCRSIHSFNLIKGLDEVYDLFERYGGHAKAAGFTIRTERVEEFKSRFAQIVRRELEGHDLVPEIKADLEIELKRCTPALLNELDKLEPTGLDNPEPVFISRDLAVKRSKTVGNDGQHLRITVSDGTITFDGIAFRKGAMAVEMPKKVDLAFRFERNYFQEKESLQLNIIDIMASKDVWEGKIP